ncbi:MAG: hypothetical protein KatS3mg076_1693 [Candidatus Binatia bacterium]|nr:MAG: hypothetical protein KatS3mg076_1693 [Candidatus Binatia bacterium]
MFVFTAWFLLAFLLLPSEAHAWGPITHVAHGWTALAELTIASGALQEILRRHRREYLYGCIGADITQAKKYTPAMQYHCHSWKVGWQILEQAETDAEKAFAYGYLSHLASDVFSHNHYVPTQLVLSYPARSLRHVYWEARFDSLQPPAFRRTLAELAGARFPECDALVERVVRRTIFSFRTDKRIFHSMVSWQQLEPWHALLLRLSSRSRFALPPDVVDAYNRACVEAIRDLLARGKEAACQEADPTGTRALALAKEIRRKLRRLARRRMLTPRLERELRDLERRAELFAA